MTKRKLIRFEENKTFNNLFQYNLHQLQEEGFPLKGKWHQEYFRNNNPIILELGCGKGEYTIGLARNHPDKNYVGIDLKGARLWRGCKTATEDKMKNVAFIRSRVDFIEYFFDRDEVNEIWITFPDPQLQKPRERKRLTSPMFLDRYRKFLKPGGIIHLKTDNQVLHEYTLEVIKSLQHGLLYANNDIYNTEAPLDATFVKTFYEQKFLQEGKPITYLNFRLNEQTS